MASDERECVCAPAPLQQQKIGLQMQLTVSDVNSTRLLVSMSFFSDQVLCCFSLLCTDPTLTITTLTQLLTSVQHWDEFRIYLYIPDSKYEAMEQFPDGTERVKALCEWYLTNHPAPSWNDVARGLYFSEEHALLDVVRRHYLKGQYLSM